MSAEITDVARIQDEDVLRRMWQETSDFGRKKEIRSHMYKLRENRLKEFYNSAEGSSVIQQTTTTTSTSDNSVKPNMSTTHADNLTDQSYVTLKSKEVRDSESPTRDSYNKTVAKHQDQGWTITSSNEKSDDGKTHISTHVASTSGTQQIDGGKLDYSAKLQEKASVFQDGDDKNFTKAVGTSSSSALRQEASGGDENSNFRSSTTKTSSSSRYVSETRNTNEDIQALPSSTTITKEQVPYSSINEENARSVVEKTYTTNVPRDLKHHPSYVEGKTKVTQETKTLADGTIVTTTRYETKQGNSTQTATHKKYSNVASTQAEQRSSTSSTHVESSRNVTSDSRHSARDDRKAIEYTVMPGSTIDINVTTARNNTEQHHQYQDVRDSNTRESVKSQQTQSTKVVRESTHDQQVNRQSDVDTRENRRVVKENVDYVDVILPVGETVTTTRTTVTKTNKPEQVQKIVSVPVDENVTTRITTRTIVSEQPSEQTDVTYRTTSSHTVNKQQDLRDSKKVVSNQFISTERQHEVNTRESVTEPEQRSQPQEKYTQPRSTPEPCRSPTYTEPERLPKSPQEPYSQPERRQPIKPGKSELDQKTKPSEGQYDTTYRSEFTNKKISVEVSPTHDAFARSLRAVTPERIIRGSPRNGSNTSLRSSTSPEKMVYPSRTSPDRRDRSTSPKKSTDRFSSTETITYKTNKNTPLRSPERQTSDQRLVNGDTSANRVSKTHHYNTDTITRRSKITTDKTTSNTIDSSTLTRKKNKPRSPSPTGTTTSDFEYVRNTNDVTTDFNTDYTKITKTNRETTTHKDSTRPTSLEITTRKVKKVTERSPTSPLTDFSSPRKSPTKEIAKKDTSPTKNVPQDKPKLIRTDTYEERVKQILGLQNDNKEVRRSSLERNSLKRSSLRETTTRTTSSYDMIKRGSRTSPTKDSPRKSPEKQYPEKRSPVKEFPAQTRKSPEKIPLEHSSDRWSPKKTEPRVSEFPSQIRKSVEREPLEPYLKKKSPTKTGPSISEFPSQIRRSPEKEPLEPYPKKQPQTKTSPPLSEFPSQVRRSPNREPLEPYPERSSPDKTGPTICEFPSQIRHSPERQPLEPYSERKSPSKIGPQVSEYPSQTRRSPEREPDKSYPERQSPVKTGPIFSEFPSQIRRSPERKPLEPYPERQSPVKTGPTVSEFPSQVRRSPERKSQEPYPEKQSPIKTGSTVSEFPSQIRRSPDREPLEPYPEKRIPSKTGPQVSEFPSQIRRSPERKPQEPYPERQSPIKTGPTVSEFPSQIRRSPDCETLEPYPEKNISFKTEPQVSEFPSQIRRSPEKKPLEPYPEKQSPTKTGPSISEFPSQIKRSPNREPLEPYPEKSNLPKTGPQVSEFPSQIRRSPEREPLEPYFERQAPTKTGPSMSEFPSQIKSPQKEPPKTTAKKSPKKSKKPRTTSEISTSTEDEEDDNQIEETLTQTTRETVETRIPVSEPTVEKKLFSQLCRADEVTRLDKKKTTQDLIEAEILQNKVTEQQIIRKSKPMPNGTLSKETPKKTGSKKTITTSEVITTDTTRNVTTASSLNKENIKEKSPVKRPVEKTPSRKIIKTTSSNKITKKESPNTIIYTAKTPLSKKQPETIYKVEKTKFIGQTEYQDQFSTVNKIQKEPLKKTEKPTGKTTLHDIENFENIKEDTSIHLRTNRVDDTVTKKKVSKTVLVNGDVAKNKPKSLPVRQPSPNKKVPVNVTSKPTDRINDIKPKSTTTNQLRYSIINKKTVNQNDIKPKTTKLIEPKKHVVTATITVAPKTGPKTKPTSKTVSSKTVTTTKTTTVRPKETTKKVSNGYVSSDTDEESVVESIEGSFIDLTEKRSQFTRTSSDQTFKSTPREPARALSKPDLMSPDKESTTRRQVITTKTVLITNEDVPNREVIVNLQRSKSSREPTPDRLCPRPLTSDEEEDSSPARYPDQISEPDDGSLRRKPKKLSDIPIFETEDTKEDTRITEITDTTKKISKVDRVEETDESLLSINKKINKFLTTADQLTKEPLKPKPAKVERPNLEVSDDLKEDECLLSVSDKVSKFINTSEQLSTQKYPDKSKSPKPKSYTEGVDVSIQKKVTQFKTSVEEANKPRKSDVGPAPKVLRPDLSNVDDELKEDECLLSVSDKVSKFISTAEKLTSTSSTKPVSLSKIDIKPTNYQESPKVDRKSPSKDTKTDRPSPSRDITTEFIQTEKKEETYTRRSPSLSPERRDSSSPGHTTPTRRPSNQYSSILKSDTTETRYTTTDSIPKDSTPKSTRRPSQESSSSTSRLKSTDSIKRAKALFENISSENDTPRQRDILSRPSVFDAKRQQTKSRIGIDQTEEITTRRSSIQKSTEDKIRSTTHVETVSRRSQSPHKSPERSTSPTKIEITKFRASSPEKIPEIVTTKPKSRDTSPEGDIPHYMMPLDRSLRPNSPHRDSFNQTKPQHPQPVNHEDTRQTKFGVTLRRTDSGRTTKATQSSTLTTERRKSSITLEKRITEEEIEEIFELEILEELLEKIVGYELRRKIRTQIRLVKKLISEGTLEEYIAKRKSLPREAITRRGSSPAKTVKPEGYSKTTEYQTSYTRKESPERKVTDKKLFEHTDVVDRRSSIQKTTEYQSSYSVSERKSSTENIKLTRKSPSPLRDRQSPLRASPERKVQRRVDVTPNSKVTTVKTSEAIPGGVRTTTTTTTENKTFTTLKKTAPTQKKIVEDNQPEWVRQRNLRNTKECTLPTTKKVSSSTTTTSTKKSSFRSSPAKEVKPTDIITSSYGVGPTDENGAPLFGLRALRAQNKNEKTKVQGTVITSQYYSENDQEPVGQVSVRKYSTDPRDLGQDGVVSTDGKMTSVTTTQKFGYDDTPSLKSLTNSKKEICDTTEKSTSKTTKLNRRGSVKEISKKFIDNAVETLKSERQTTYPKAGLILRTSSFKSTNGESHSRESSPDDRETETSTVTVRTMKTSTSGETFLSNKNKVTGVQDVISRMKAEEYEEGDTEEDIAARGLLNKFIGAQVILSGMESMASSAKSKTTESTSPTGTVRRSTKITTTVTEGGKPTTTTRVFQRPVTEKEISTVWDEQTLRLLLEQSTDYEERRIVRIRLRQVMAEQEACTALVDEATKSEEPSTPTTPTIPGQLEGESQLLPLLQGLLAAPENDITPDSGTESGEDQRSSLIAEVQGALEKLSNSLRNDQTDITPERRSSLLQLVTKLQAGLNGSNASERRASTVSSGGRFQKRKNKQSRHTVGVSKEELADARKLIEEISLTPSDSVSKMNLSKQNSESSVPTSSASSSYRNIHQPKVKNTTPKPFSSSNSTSSSAQTPTEHFDGFDVLFNDEKDNELTCHDAVPVQQKATPTYAKTVQQSRPNLERNVSVDSNVSIKSAYKAVQQAAALKREQSKDNKDDESQSEGEDGSSTVIGASDLENASLKSNPIYSKPSNSISQYEEKSSRFDTQKKLRMKRANTIDIPKPMKFYEDEDETDSEHEDDTQKRRDSYYALRGPINVSNPHTKKIVPTFEPKTESDKKFLAFINNHNENAANKGSMWTNNSSVWGSRFGNIKSTFEKTSSNNAKSFWKSADDSITKSSTNQFGPKISRRSARNLQQMFEEKQKESQKSIPAARQSFANTGQAKSYNASGQKQSNIVTGSLQVKTVPEKNYRVIPQPLPVNQFSHAPQSAFKPIQKAPQSSNRTSVVFSPEGGEIVKKEIKSTSGSAFLYSPKPLSSSVESSTVTSPVASKPWAANTGGSRVFSMAASKFEQAAPQQPFKPRKLSKDAGTKVFIPTNQINSNVIDRTPSYLGKGADNKSSTVRKLSGHYENIDNNTDEHQIQPKQQTYQVKTSVVESQYTPPVKHYVPPVKAPTQSAPMPPSQNYSIRYDQPQNHNAHPIQQKTFSAQPQNYSIRYDQTYPQPSHPQNYSIRYDNPQIQQHINQNQSYQHTAPQNYNTNYDQTRTQKYQPQQPIQQYPQQTFISHEQQTQNSLPQPQNYSIRYDQPQTNVQTPQTPNYKPQNYTIRYDQPQIPPVAQSNSIYQHIPGKESQTPQNYSVLYNQPKTPPAAQENSIYQHIPNEAQPTPKKESKQKSSTEKDIEYTSTCEFKPTQSKVPVQAIEPVVQAPKIQRQVSEESVHEHIAVSSRVMSGPVSQQAVTVRQKSPMNRDQHDMEAAFNLRNSLQKVSKQEPSTEASAPKPTSARSPARSPSNSFSYRPKEPEVKSPSLSQSFKSKTGLPTFDPVKYKPSDCPKPTVAPSTFKFKSTFEDTHREPKSCGVVKPMQQKTNVTRNNVSNAVKPQEKLQINEKGQSVVTGQFHIPLINVKSPESPRPPTQAQVLSKSDSWHEICLARQTTSPKPPPKSGPVKSKSSHTLAVPKMFEAGMSKDEMLEKRKTMEAFLTGNKTPPNEGGVKTVKRSINRVKTSQKVSTQKKVSGGLSRSRTLPDIICPDLLDESNVDKAFDELFETA